MNKSIILIIVAVMFVAVVGWMTLYVPVAEPKIDPVSEKVETYLRENITTLSPVEEVLGGTWYVVSVIVDPMTSSGTVIYEDGHVQEEREFSFTVGEDGEIANLEIK